VSAAIGYTVPAPLPSSDADSLSCSYLASGVDDVEINYQTTAPGTTAASLLAELKSGAAAGSSISAVSGYGQAAFSNVGSAGGGVAILVLTGNIEFGVTGGTSLSGVEAVAKMVLTS
jgi:hypothetical protein